MSNERRNLLDVFKEYGMKCDVQNCMLYFEGNKSHQEEMKEIAKEFPWNFEGVIEQYEATV